MASSKFIVALFVAAMVACAAAQLVPISGTRDISGGYLDHYTGQYSSAITGRVYNTAPVVAHAPVIAHAPAVAVAHPAVAVAHPAIATHHVAPLAAWIRR